MKYLKTYENNDDIKKFLKSKFKNSDIFINNSNTIIILKFGWLDKKTTLKLIEYFGDNEFEITPMDSITNFYVYNIPKSFYKKILLDITENKYNL